MTPFLSPLSAPVVGGSSPGRSSSPVSASPVPALRYPSGFRPILGEATAVEFTSWLPPTAKGHSAAQKAGLRYERQTLDKLQERFGPALHVQPAISFCDNTGHRVAIPDALLRLGPDLAILEIKYTHTDLAWWQLRRLYEPLLFKLTRARILLIEVCKSYDPAVDFPEPHTFIPDFPQARASRAPVSVLQFR